MDDTQRLLLAQQRFLDLSNTTIYQNRDVKQGISVEFLMRMTLLRDALGLTCGDVLSYSMLREAQLAFGIDPELGFNPVTSNEADGLMLQKKIENERTKTQLRQDRISVGLE
jgi:hypothetical protein